MADPRPWHYGTPGNDIILTSGINERFSGQDGNDWMFAGSYDDMIGVPGGLPTDNILRPGMSLRPDPLLAAGRQSSGILAGAAGDDTVIGAGGNDILYGTEGNDVLEGGMGGDLLTGGAGADVFVFRPLLPFRPVADTAGDYVTDFEPSLDKLDLSAYQNPHLPGFVWKGTEPLTQGTKLQVGYTPDPEHGAVVRFYAPYTGYAGPFPAIAPAYAMTGEIRTGVPGELAPSDFILGPEAHVPAPVLPSPPAPEQPAPPPVVAAPQTPAKVFADEYQAQATRLYDTVFGRIPDAEGLEFWRGALSKGYSLDAVADGFMQAPEFQATYGVPDNQRFVGLLYQNVLDREGEPGGMEFWTSALDGHRADRSDIVVGFSEAPEHQAKVTTADYLP